MSRVRVKSKSFPSVCVRVKSKVLPEPYGPLGSADLRSIGPQPDTSLHCKGRGYGASASHGVSVYSPAVRLVPKLYCLVREAHGCEQLAQSCYLVAARPGIKLTTSQS